MVTYKLHLCVSFEDDPEERTNLADTYPDTVTTLLNRIYELAPSERLPDLEAEVDNPLGDASNYGGVWSSGWC